MEFTNLLTLRKGSRDNSAKIQDAPLFKLPLDVLLLITDHLSPSETTCLTLCSKSLLGALGKERFSSLASEHKEKILITLAHDLPAYFYCYYTRRLH